MIPILVIAAALLPWPQSEKAAAKPAAAKAPVVYLTAWPAPANKEATLTDVEKLCKARTPEMSTQAKDALVGGGAACVPFLLDRLGREKDEAAVKRVREVLLEVTSADQTRLLAKEFDGKAPTVRVFCLHRASSFPDAGIRQAAESSWKRIEKAGDKVEADERYAAALCLASAGSIGGLDNLMEAAKKSWDKNGVEIRAALEGVRGPEASKQVADKLEGADQKQKVAVLHMLAGCGDKSAMPRVRFFLDDDDNQVRVAAINACRGIVDGAPPEEQLPVFEAIESAKKWKERVW
jgi:HEAT repeat protein